MKYNPLDGDRAANYYDSLPEKEKEGVMSLDEALEIKKKKKCAGFNFKSNKKCKNEGFYWHLEDKKWYCKKCSKNYPYSSSFD